MNPIEISIYATNAGKEPFSDWESKLDKKVRAIILRRLDNLTLGNFGDAKRIQNGAGVWELRVDFGPGYRIYFGRVGMQVVVLLAGGDKKNQNNDIEKAKKYWLEYRGLP